YIGGIQIGDNIVKIDNKRIKNSQDVSEILNKIKKSKVEVTFEEEGDIVSLDIGAYYKGYHGDSAKTHGVGMISEEDRKLIEVTR
ncbi:M24 family metallopeptidase, partial [Clostridioides difficile]